MKLLDDYKKLIADKEAGKDPRNILVKLWSSIASMFVTPVNETRKGYATVYKKLNECVEVGNLAIATGDDKVIIDFAKEIKKEQKNEQDTYIKDLYQIFLVILYEHQDLIKCPWWKWEALSYKGKRLLQWNPAWENLLTTPELKNKEYDTRASQWSDANFKKTDNRINNETLAQSNALVQAQGIIEEKDQIIEQGRLKEEERQSKGRNRKRKGQQSLKKH